MQVSVFFKVFGIFATFVLLFATVPGSVLAASLDAPSGLSLSSWYSSNDTTPTFSWSRPLSATWYSYRINLQEWQNVSNVSSVTLSALADGWYTFYVRAHDNSGQVSAASSYTFEIDTQGPTVPAVSPSSAVENKEVIFSVKPSGESAVVFCHLYISGKNKGTMTKTGTTFSFAYTFSQEGSYSVFARCADGDGNYTTGSSRTVRVTEAQDPLRGSLIKLRCGSAPTAHDPCRAVYYLDEEGKRHAFPNESVFFTWFSDFSSVNEVTSSYMSTVPLGANVTYRPGSVLVKFVTSPKVYAIEKRKTLRHYTTMALLHSDYGSDGEKFIVTLPDSWYTQYELGEVIDSTRDFDRTDAYYSVESIEDIF